MAFPNYRKHFLGATDETAYTAIRNKVDGNPEYLGGMQAGQDVDLTLDNGVGADHTKTFDI